MLTLRNINQKGYLSYVNDAIPKIAEEYIVAGLYKEENALANTKELFKKLLPKGVDTKDQYLFDIFDDNMIIGIIWYNQRNKVER